MSALLINRLYILKTGLIGKPFRRAAASYSEQHLILHFDVFKNTRYCLFEILSALMPGFKQLSDPNKCSTFMCPTTPHVVNLVKRFIKFMFQKKRKDKFRRQ